MSQESDLRTKLAELVTEHTGLACLAYKPVITLPADFVTLGIDPAVGYAYVHIPSGVGKRHDLRLDVEIHVLKQGVLNGSGYDATAGWAEAFGEFVTDNQGRIEGFSDPAQFSGTRDQIEVAGTEMWDSTISFCVVTSA